MIIKLFESFITATNYKDKIVEDITDMFIELKDSGLNYLVSMQDNSTVDIVIYKNKKDVVFDLDLVKDCVEMAKHYLSDLWDLREFYRFGYVSERVTARMTNNGVVYDKKQSRNNIDYLSFPDNWSEDIENKHALEHRFDYELEVIKIEFKPKLFKNKEKVKLDESSAYSGFKGNLIEEIDNVLVELTDDNFWFSKELDEKGDNYILELGIEKEIPEEHIHDWYEDNLNIFFISDVYEPLSLLVDWMQEKYSAVLVKGTGFFKNEKDKDYLESSVSSIRLKFIWKK